MSENGATGNGRPAHGGPGRGEGVPRVSVAYSFYRLRPEAFDLSPDDRRRLGEEFASVAEDAAGELGLFRTYSLVGLRPDADLLLWQAADQPEGLQRFAARLRATRLYRYLELSHQYLAMTRRSIYVDQHVHEGQDGRRTRVQPTGAPYLFVYPFVKTRAWYALPYADRQAMMDEHIATGHKYPDVKINTTYCFGIDDQEFVVAFEAQNPSRFLDLVMELRSSRASAYTLRDTPAFTAVACPLDVALSLALGTADEATLAQMPPAPALAGASA